jgi:hypothetical protein
MNFELIKQCLTRLQDLEMKMNQDKNDRESTNKEIY